MTMNNNDRIKRKMRVETRFCRAPHTFCRVKFTRKEGIPDSRPLEVRMMENKKKKKNRNDILSTNSKFVLQFHPHMHDGWSRTDPSRHVEHVIIIIMICNFSLRDWIPSIQFLLSSNAIMCL